MLNVFITVDTEILDTYTRTADAKSKSAFLEDIQNDIYGVTPNGEFGIRFQMDVLNTYKLKAVFFVDSLFARAVGLDALREMVGVIQEGQHEVQLHLHTEWLKKTSNPILQGRTGQNIKDFSEEEQQLLIAQGLENLRACGVKDVCAFRAGNYGANFNTLRALARNGILYDTSHNTCYLDSTCDMRTKNLLLQPKQMYGIYEFPVGFFKDRPGHYRHAQLCACSSWEMENALMEASKRGWYSFVIVLHSSELIKRGKQGRKICSLATPDRIVTKRFERLCRFLAKNRDKFHTATFSELAPDAIPAVTASQPLESNLFRSAWRYAEQFARRCF